jgi:hypothetical protein
MLDQHEAQSQLLWRSMTERRDGRLTHDRSHNIEDEVRSGEGKVLARQMEFAHAARADMSAE